MCSTLPTTNDGLISQQAHGKERRNKRTVRNVGEMPAVYYAAVDMFDGDVTVDVVPRELEFSEENQEQRFEVAVGARRNDGAKVVQGALRWVSDTYTVRSPISISFL